MSKNDPPPTGLLGSVDFRGAVQASDDVSAIAKVHDYLVIGADEAIQRKKEGKAENVIQLFKRVGDAKSQEEAVHDYEHHGDITIQKSKEKEEVDTEGIAAVGDTIYVVGSHSKKRPKAKPEKTYQRNLKTFRENKVEEEPSRARVFRLRVDKKGKPVGGDPDRINLTEIIRKDPVLTQFHKIPSKENGIDIEGIAADGDWLYLGFRGPVLRGGYVPVMRLKFDAPKESYSLSYVTLGGRGIRDMARVDNGFLLLAGPVGDGPGSYQVYHWDGRDMVPGERKKGEPKIGKVTLLKELALSGDAKAEGLVVLNEAHGCYEMIIVFDGVLNLLALRYRLPQP